MAKPRIFISSTYFDLKIVRSDLERYIRERNFDPILNEKGHIAYSSEKKLEEYCYKEIENCDILISIIGGRFGSTSQHDGYSISQKELKTAFELGKQVYIFIEKAVLTEYKTYEKNKDILDKIKFFAVDSPKIYSFLDEVFALPINNQYTGFETSYDIIAYLQEQWSSLFHRLLTESAKQKEVSLMEDLKSTAKTLNQLVTFLTEERKSSDTPIKEILFANHPIFSEIKSELKIPFRVFFYNYRELSQLLRSRGYAPVDRELWDETDIEEWYKNLENYQLILRFKKSVFDDDGKLKLFTPEEWNDGWVKLSTIERPAHSDLDDDLPF